MRFPQLSPRVAMYALALVCALWIGAELTSFVNRQGIMLPNSIVPVGRDFVVFYSAGRIVANGEGAELYDSDRQLLEISRITNNDSLPWRYAYPAFFVLPYALFSFLPYLYAFAIAAFVFTTALVGGVLILRSVSSTARAYSFLIVLALFAYQPVISQVFSGLNVGLTLLLLSGAYVALVQRRERTAGVWLGMLLFKPQFAVPLLGLLAWRRQWRTLAAAAVTASSLTLAAAIAVSPTWPLSFARFVLSSNYRYGERKCCGQYHVSLLEAAALLFPNQPLMYWLIAALGVAAVVLTLRVWAVPNLFDHQFPFRFGLGLAVILAWSPHALFYETALLIIPVIALVDTWRRGPGDGAAPQRLSGKRQLFLAGLLAGGMTSPLVRVIGIQPMVLLPLIVGAACWHQLRKATESAHTGKMQPIPLDSHIDQWAGDPRPSLAERRAS